MNSSFRKLSVVIMAMCFLITAKAQIIYTDVKPDSVISANQSYNLDLNNDGIADFRIRDTAWLVHLGRCGIATDYILTITPLHNNAVLSDSLHNVYALQANSVIAANNSTWFTPANQRLAQVQWACGSCGDFCYHLYSYGSGNWFNTSGGKYAGLKLIKGSNTYYGWVRLSNFSFPPGPALTLLDYAYNSIPNQSILAGQTSTTLAVTLFNLNGALKNNKIELTWSASSELNNKGFEIEKSINSQTFYSIGFINSKGNNTLGNDYTFTDADLKNENNFYRLKEIDINGNFTYSNVVQISYSNYNQLTVYPNPVSNTTTISFNLPQSQKVSVTIYDMNGRLIKTLADIQMQQGPHQLTWNARSENVIAGTYFLKLQTTDQTETKKISVIK